MTSLRSGGRYASTANDVACLGSVSCLAVSASALHPMVNDAQDVLHLSAARYDLMWCITVIKEQSFPVSAGCGGLLRDSFGPPGSSAHPSGPHTRCKGGPAAHPGAAASGPLVD